MVRRSITADGGALIRSPNAPRAHENELERAVSYMVDQISQRFSNQVFNQLHQKTIEKFADAQIGNYAKVYLTLADRVRRKLVKQFDDDRITQLARTVLDKANRHNRADLYAKVEKRIGLSTKELTASEGLTSDINALVLETARWVQKLRDETIENYTASSLHAMTTGASLEDVMEQYKGLVEKRKNHAKFTARNQITNFNSVTTKIRAQNLGITQAVWVTSHDERVRTCHKERDGKTFDLAKGLYSSCDQKWLLPGVDYQCRCDYKLIIPED